MIDVIERIADHGNMGNQAAFLTELIKRGEITFDQEEMFKKIFEAIYEYQDKQVCYRLAESESDAYFDDSRLI